MNYIEILQGPSIMFERLDVFELLKFKQTKFNKYA